MKLNLINLDEDLIKGVNYLKETLNFETGDDGVPVIVSKGGEISVSMSNGVGKIVFSEKHHFFRALGLFLENLKESGDFSVKETAKFSTMGIMLDASRNGVMKIDSIKKYLRYMAVMGMNMLMMYTEDTFEVPETPYFGYMRGKYSYDELKECDDYAYALGIEMIPCIQTLGHMAQYIKWNAAGEIKDTYRTLLADEEKTYDFIEKMICAAIAPYRSKRIHIGMDEAHDMGRGAYMDKHGYKNPFDIFIRHLNRVVEITNKYGLRPMIWSDMFFRIGSKTHAYYDVHAVIPRDVIQKIPKEVQLVFWEYNRTDKELVNSMLDKHLQMGRDVLLAGGICTWHGMLPENRLTLTATNLVLSLCKQKRISEVFATVWGDNGCETNQFMSIWGMQFFAEHAYCDMPETEKLKKRLAFCTGADYDAFLEMSDFHSDEQENITLQSRWPIGKRLLWQDVLTGLMDSFLFEKPMSNHYKLLAGRMKSKCPEAGEWKKFYIYAASLFELLEKKCFIAERLKPAYDKNDRGFLKVCQQTHLPELFLLVKKMKQIHKEQWHSTYKPFGWEVLDIRYGGLLARIETAIERIGDFLEGRLDSLPELDEPRLSHDIASQILYNRIATACDVI
jgi:hexosaminidase